MEKKARVVVLAALLVFVFSASLVLAQSDVEGLKNELKSMQQKVDSLQDRLGALESEQSSGTGISNVTWHGYIATNYQDETKVGAEPYFDAFVLALIPKFTISEKANVYAQLVYEHMPFYDISVSSAGVRSLDTRSSGEFVVNDAYLQYTINDYLYTNIGKFATPFGLWNTLQYACPTYVTIKQPGRETIYSRGSDTESDANLYGRYSMGAWLAGKYDIFLYDLYIANGRTTLNLHKDDDNNKALGGRLGVETTVGESNLKVLYSYYGDSLRDSTTTPFYNQYTNALSGEVTFNELKIISEFADSRRDGKQIDAFYVLAQYNLTDKITPFAQFQYYDPNGDSDTHKDQTRYTSWGLAYQLIPARVILKAQIDRVEPQKKASSTEDYNVYSLGVAAAF